MEIENEFAESTTECFESHAHAIAIAGEHACVAGREIVKILNASTGEVTFTLAAHSHDVNALALVDSTLFTGASAQGRSETREYLKSWDISTGKLLKTFGAASGGQCHTNDVWALATAPGMLISGAEDGSIRVWDPETAECIRKLDQGHNGRVRCLCYCKEDGKLYSGGHDSKVLVWDLSTGEQVGSFAGGQGGWITAILVEGERLYTASTDKTVFVYDKASGEKQAILDHDNWVSSLACHQGVLFTGVGDSTVCAWDPVEAVLKYKLKGHEEFNAVSALVVHQAKLCSVGWDGALTKWDITAVEDRCANAAPPPQAAETVNTTKAQDVQPASSNNIFDLETDCNLLD